MTSTMNVEVCFEDFSHKFASMVINTKTTKTETKSGVLMVVDECDPQYFPLLRDVLQIPSGVVTYHYNTRTAYQTIYFYVSEVLATKLEKIERLEHIYTAPRRSSNQPKFPNLNNRENYKYNYNLLKSTFEMERIAYLFSQN